MGNLLIHPLVITIFYMHFPTDITAHIMTFDKAPAGTGEGGWRFGEGGEIRNGFRFAIYGIKSEHVKN